MFGGLCTVSIFRCSTPVFLLSAMIIRPIPSGTLSLRTTSGITDLPADLRLAGEILALHPGRLPQSGLLDLRATRRAATMRQGSQLGRAKVCRAHRGGWRCSQSGATCRL